MTAIRRVCGIVAAFALGLGTAAIADAQSSTFCASYPCYQVNVDTTDGAGSVVQFSDVPFSSSQQGSNVNGNQESAYGIAQLGSVGSATSVDLVACPSTCLALVQANAAGFYWDAFDPRNLGYTAGEMFQFSMALSGSFGSGPPLAQVSASIALISGANVGSAGLTGNSSLPPGSSATASVIWDPTFDPLIYLQLGVDTSTALSPLFGGFGSNFADFSTTFSITGVELLDPSGNFLREIELTDVAGFTIPSHAPVQTAPEPATLLLVVGALAALGSRRLHVRGVGDH
jgi:hypothetical protein